MKVNRKYILISVIALFILGGIFLLPNTAWFQNIKQLIFINQVVKQTAEQDAFEIELHVQYDLLGYEMQLQGNGRVQSNTAHFNHIVALNGKGVSPMTLDLEQYIVKNDDTSIMYMSLNEGQWFKETAQPSSTMHNQFLHFNDLSSL
ncbi:MAG TPA: hypothetical protein DCY20_10485, partial [Firmicutes bacterium]|nr:hypothetical protein [Bacillota bacterium]